MHHHTPRRRGRGPSVPLPERHRALRGHGIGLHILPEPDARRRPQPLAEGGAVERRHLSHRLRHRARRSRLVQAARIWRGALPVGCVGRARLVRGTGARQLQRDPSPDGGGQSARVPHAPARRQPDRRAERGHQRAGIRQSEARAALLRAARQHGAGPRAAARPELGWHTLGHEGGSELARNPDRIRRLVGGATLLPMG